MLVGNCSTSRLHRVAASIRYPSDDINKFLWMVRIGGGVFPDIKEKDYLGEGGYRVDAAAGKVQCSSWLAGLAHISMQAKDSSTDAQTNGCYNGVLASIFLKILSPAMSR